MGIPAYPEDLATKFAELERRLNALAASSQTRVPFTGGVLPGDLTVQGTLTATTTVATTSTVTGTLAVPGTADIDGTLMVDNQEILPTARRVKAFNEGRNSTTFADDEFLYLFAEAGKTYLFDGFIIYSGLAAADIKLHFTAPVDATFKWARGGQALGASLADGPFNTAAQDLASNPTLGCLGAGVELTAMPVGTLVMGATPGALQLQWAQQVADAGNPSLIYAGSWVRLMPEA